MKTMLLLIAALALVILLAQVVIQYHSVRQGGAPAKRRRATINFVLLLVMILSFSGSFYAGNRPLLKTSADVSQSKPEKESNQDDGNLTLAIPDKLVLKDGSAQVQITIPKGTKLEIYSGDTLLATIDNSKQTRDSKLTYRFDQAGVYRIVGKRHQQRFAKRLEVTAPQATEASSSSANQTSESKSAPAQPAASSNDGSTTTYSSGTATSNTDASPVPGYHYEYRAVQVPVDAQGQ